MFLSPPIKILIAEHDPADLELIIRQLIIGEIDFIWETVNNEETYSNILKVFAPDIILCDYSFPSFDGYAAFEIKERLVPGTPFIFVSGTIGEEKAVELIKLGVTDYALKDRLVSLPFKIERALKELKEKQEKDRTEKELIRSKELLVEAQAVSKLGSWETDLSNMQVVWSDETYKIFEIVPAEFKASHKTVLEYVHPDDREKVDNAFMASVNSYTLNCIEHRIVTPGGLIKIVEDCWRIFRDEKGVALRAVGTCQDITERKRSEDKIKESELRYRSLIEQATDAICITDSSMHFIDVNTYACEILGYTKEEALQLSLPEVLFPEDLVTNPFRWNETIPGRIVRNERRLKRKDGNSIMMEVSTRLMEDGRLIMFGHDISERKKAEAYIRNSEEKRRLIMNAALDAIICIDTAGNITFWNPQAKVIFGWGENEVMGKRLSSFIIPENFRRYHDAGIENYLKTGEGKALNVLLELSAIKKSGEEFPIELTVMPIRQGDGEFFCAFIRDITERKNAEKEIKESNQRYNYATKATFDAIWDWDIVSNKVFWGEGFINLFGEMGDGKTNIEILNKRIHPDDLEDLLKSVNVTLKGTDLNWNYEHRYRKSDGTYAYVSNKALIIRDERGWATRVIGAMQDITERKKAEYAVIETLTEKNIILESIGDAFFAVDKNWIVTYWNNQAEKMLHKPKNEIVGYNLWEVFPGSTATEAYRLYHEAIKNNEVIHFEDYYPVLNKWYEISAYPSNIGLSVYFKDITERKLSEIRLNELNENLQRHAKQLAISNAELEQFAYVTSHDLQEPLRMVTSFLTLLEKKYEDIIDDKGKKYIAFAVDGAKRMRQIILDLLEFSKVGKMEDKQEAVDLNELVKEIEILFRKEIKDKNASLKIDSLSTIQTYKSPVRQIFQNLISNALKYTLPNVAPQIEIKETQSTTHWHYTVADNGIGINQEYFQKIFIIFQRLHNKDEYSGTGMGLAVTKKIIENLGGSIWLESEEGKGSTFYFTLLKQP